MSKTPMTRRQFLIKGASLLALVGTGSGLLLHSRLKPSPAAKSDEGLAAKKPGAVPDDTRLVVVQLSGGNDGINTVIPYSSGIYYDSRPTLGYKQSEVLALDKQYALHPSLKNLHDLYKQGKLAIVNGTGYPNPNRSHFRSMEIWQTAAPDRMIDTGWLGRYADTSLHGDDNPLSAVQIGSILSKALYAKQTGVPVIQSMDAYYFLNPRTPKWDQNRLSKAFLDMYQSASASGVIGDLGRRGLEAYQSVEALHSLHVKAHTAVQYPQTEFGRDLQLASDLLNSDAGTKVVYLQTSGFDDHASEKDQHARVLQNVDEGLGAFYHDLAAKQLADKVMVLVFSEFGRRVRENSSGGTDHGTAGPLFVLGGRVKGGLYGEYPSLTNLDQGDLKYQMDFRSVYTTLVEDWLRGDAQTAVGGKFEKLKFITT